VRRRSARIGLVAAAVVVFLVLSALLARVLTANEAERTRVVRLLDAEARGDARAAVRLVGGCPAIPACSSALRAQVTRLRHPGRVEVLRYEPATHFSLGGSRGVARVAWRIATGPPIVQCIGIHRTGNPIGGLGVQLTAVSAPIPGEAGCPSDAARLKR
jgi:hypothetical protein